MNIRIREYPNRVCVIAALSLTIIAGCAAPPPAGPVPGSDRDAHGCIGSAGYSWCERSGQCERPWELAAKEGFDNSVEAFDNYCSAPATGNEANAGAESGGG
ncbi:hypothetical protein [Marilutibacter chinensis]|uniref:Peptidase n=1 Tax=Marilutibacter chinensis TaxID=2912247 RepID=A0ABS9HZQ9_9GAMM|nr:hypothetical protein [Lysobacter chinensis]MCF7223624.1 hypothetical protein [Lysobacter chinensis]